MFLCKIILKLYLATSKIRNKKERMKLGKIAVVILSLTLGFLSCSKNSSSDDPVVIEVRDRGAQQILDKDSIIGYLETHYYNAGAFQGNADPSISELIIAEIPSDGVIPDPDNNKKLIDSVVTKTIVFEGTEYDIYILDLNQGGGEDSPTFADNVLVTYEGFTLNDVVFDSAVNPVTFDLTSLIPGWRKVLPDFNTAESFVDGDDGTVDFMNHGVGVMFVPSGLGYFSGSQSGIPAYSPLIFKFELLKMYEADFDGDGIPSYMEDLNGDGEFIINYENSKDENDDDTDGDFIPNYGDTDDDGDGILTKNETNITISTINKPTREEVKTTPLEKTQKLLNKIVKEIDGTFTGTIWTFKDSDGDKIPDYLDKD
jgi:FKBP-type peptidyl-prolyl cis-trans isomerase